MTYGPVGLSAECEDTSDGFAAIENGSPMKGKNARIAFSARIELL